jgi:hypothetical protein
MAGSQAITNNTASCFFDVAWSFSPLLVFVLMAGSRAITNNTASCFYYFITDFFAVVGVRVFLPLLVFVLMAGSQAITNNTASCSFAVVGVRVDGRKPGNHQQHSILFLLFYNRLAGFSVLPVRSA